MLPAANTFAGTPLQRVSHLRKDAAWLADARKHPRARVVPVRDGRNLVRPHPAPAAVLLTQAEAAPLVANPADLMFLGLLEEAPYFTVDLSDQPENCLAELGEFRSLRTVGALLTPGEASLLAYSRALVLWHREHRFCTRCASPLRVEQGGHVLLCGRPGCGGQQFPRLDPAIIVLVDQGEHCLLGRQSSWPAGRFSTIAGFVEPGESIEDAVAREVLEETGVRTSAVRYHSSQPWPFPSSLMLGFRATAGSTDIALIDGELEQACWFDRAALGSGKVLLPPPLSISYRLIESWFDEAPGHRLSQVIARTGSW